MPDHSKFQKGVIKRYYDNRDSIALQKLAEIVSNLYLETSEAKIKRSWKSAHTQMLAAGIHPHQADHILEEKDLGALAKIISELT
ncbi:MAG: hypothetical protein ACI9EF_001923 [Pseudohongiellaceae bacterium]|jgi:hypothetical protein